MCMKNILVLPEAPPVRSYPQLYTQGYENDGDLTGAERDAVVAAPESGLPDAAWVAVVGVSL